jgi:hypothetical protein
MRSLKLDITISAIIALMMIASIVACFTYSWWAVVPAFFCAYMFCMEI